MRRWRLRALRPIVCSMVLAAFVAVGIACGSQATGPTTSVQWNVKSLTTKSKTGEVTRAEVTGYFIFTSAIQSAPASDGTLPPSSGTFVEDVTLTRVRRVQSATYTINDQKTLSLLVGDHNQTYAYKITTISGVQTMTWDGQDETAAHWVLEVAETPDAGSDAATDGPDAD